MTNVVDLNDLARSNDLFDLADLISNALVQVVVSLQEEHTFMEYEMSWECLCRYTNWVLK